MVVVLVTDWQEGVWWPRGSMSAKAPSRSRRQSPPGPTSGGPGGRWWERPSENSLEVASTATTTTTTATTTTTTAIASATFFLFLRILSSRSWSACPGVFDHHSFSWVEGYMITSAFFQYIISIHIESTERAWSGRRREKALSRLRSRLSRDRQSANSEKSYKRISLFSLWGPVEKHRSTCRAS